MEPEIAQGLYDIEEEPMEEEPAEEEDEPVQKKGKKGKEKASKNSRKENEGAPRGRPRTKKEPLREGMFAPLFLYAQSFEYDRLCSFPR